MPVLFSPPGTNKTHRVGNVVQQAHHRHCRRRAHHLAHQAVAPAGMGLVAGRVFCNEDAGWGHEDRELQEEAAHLATAS